MMRLDKYLANYGVGTRSEVKKLIKKSFVTVNDCIVKQSDYKLQESDVVKVDGQEIIHKEFYYLMLNKPNGVISATFDDYHETVLDLLDHKYRHVFPVGRLDIDTEGLLLLTNDGKLAHDLLSPKKHVTKSYLVYLNQPVQDDYIDRFKKGIELDDGYCCMPAELEIISKDCAIVSIQEGKFHQIKRMFQSLGNEVVYLKRLSMGTLQLDTTLELGQYRELTDSEIELLKGAS